MKKLLIVALLMASACSPGAGIVVRKEFQPAHIQKDMAVTLEEISKEARELENAAKQERDNHIAGVKAELESAIEKLRADSQIEIDRTIEAADVVFHRAEAVKNDKRAAAEADYRPKEAELKEKIGQAKAMVEQHAKAEKTREMIGQVKREVESLDAESSKLTDAMGKLEILKASLLETLPIEGLSVVDGDIQVGGIPYDRVNTAKKVQLAIEIAKLRSGSLGLIACDGLELLDPQTFEAFKKAAAKSKLQFVISRVSDGPLAIETEVA